MRGGFIVAWLIGEGIVSYRTYKKYGAPPGPGQLLYTSGLFVLLALLSEAPKARSLAVTLAYGFDIAAFFNLAPQITGSGNTSEKTNSGKAMWPPPTCSPNILIPDGKTNLNTYGRNLPGKGTSNPLTPSTTTT